MLDGARNRPLLATTFEPLATVHPTEVVSPGFVLASTAAVGESRTVEHHPVTLQAPYVGVEAELRGPAGPGTAVLAVATADGELSLRAEAAPATGAVDLVLTVGGADTALGSVRRPLPAGCTLGLALCENQAAVLLREDGGRWEVLLAASTQVTGAVDFRDPAVLARLGIAWGARGGAVTLGAARGGVFGMVGLRDPHLVQHADGTPYVEDGHVYLTWTCAGPGFFRQAHWGVFRVPLDDPTSLVQVAHLFTERDGVVVGDHAGQVVRDGDEWILATSSWGDFDGSGVHVRVARTARNPLAGVHVLRTERVHLPTRVSAWDPALTRVDGRWRVAYVESPSQDPFVFHPGLAETTAADPFEGLRRVGADAALTQTEGTLLVRDADGWRLLASDGDARVHRVYDLRMREIGVLRAPYGTNIPHAQVVPLPDGGWLLMTFDGTSEDEDVVGYGAHGSVVVMRG